MERQKTAKAAGATDHFTRKGFERASCPEGKKQIYVADPRTRGLYLQVSAKGTKSFVFRRKIGNTWRQSYIGDVNDISIENARNRACEHNSSLANGDNLFDKTRLAKEEPTLRALFQQYIERHANKRKTSEQMQKDFERWFKDLAERKAIEISTHDANKLHGELGTSAPYAANRAVQLVRAVFNKAKEYKIYFGDNPFSGITLFEETPRNRFLSTEEVARILKALNDEPYPHLRNFIFLDLLIGARKGNLLSMKWSELNLQTGTWTIPKAKSKNGREQLVPLGGIELALLNSIRKDQNENDLETEFVFPGSGKSGHLKQVQKSWTSFRKRTGFIDHEPGCGQQGSCTKGCRPNVRIHDLRRSLASTMASQNVNLALIKNIMNHKDMKTTLAVYAHTGKQAELEAKQVAHEVWLQAAGLSDKKNNIAPLKRSKGKS